MREEGKAVTREFTGTALIPAKMWSSIEGLEALGLETVGSERIDGDGPYYRKVTLPDGWKYVEDGGTGCGYILDDRGIMRVTCDDDHAITNRGALTKVVDVGAEAAGRLYNPRVKLSAYRWPADADVLAAAAGELEAAQFALLEDEEVERMMEELERLAAIPIYDPGAAMGIRARFWIQYLRPIFIAQAVQAGATS
jgi:hypothetical protein